MKVSGVLSQQVPVSDDDSFLIGVQVAPGGERDPGEMYEHVALTNPFLGAPSGNGVRSLDSDGDTGDLIRVADAPVDDDPRPAVLLGDPRELVSNQGTPRRSSPSTTSTRPCPLVSRTSQTSPLSSNTFTVTIFPWKASILP